MRSVVRTLTDAGLDVFWDDDLKPGEWESQLLVNLRASDVFIVLITEEVVRRGTGSFVHDEITAAIDNDTGMILPIIVGELNFDTHLGRLSKYQAIQVDAISDIIARKVWHDYVADIKNFLATGGKKSIPINVDADAAGWPVNGDHIVERQALALALVMLEGELPFMITDAAASLQRLMETDLRPETKKEIKARPRSFVGASQTELLASIGARRQIVAAGYNASQEVVRFIDRNQRVRLLEYLWKEQPQVRALLIQWVLALIVQGRSEGLALHLGRGLAHLAQIDLHGLRYEVLGQMLTPPMRRNERVVLSELLAAAYDIKANRPIVREILQQVYEGGTENQGEVSIAGRENAVLIALGALAERSPAPALEVLKQIQPFITSHLPHSIRLQHIILSSPMVYGRKSASNDDKGFESFSDEMDGKNAATTGTDDDALLTKVADQIEPPREGIDLEPGPAASVDLADEGEIGDATAPRVTAGLPAANFLRALAGLIDEKVAQRDPIRKKELLIKRQLPLWVFLSAFARMPLYAMSAPQRLTLEELVFDINNRNSAILDAIERGIVRAALAKPQQGSPYRAARHLQYVCRLFAYERHISDHRQEGEHDPYLVFMRRMHRAIAVEKPGLEDVILRGSGRFVTKKDISFITTAPMRKKEIL